MKKTESKRFKLSKETLRLLKSTELDAVKGGMSGSFPTSTQSRVQIC